MFIIYTNKNFPTPSNKKPWINSHLKCLSHKKQRLYNLAKSISCPIKWETYRNFKKTVQQESHKVYHSYLSSLTDKMVQ